MKTLLLLPDRPQGTVNCLPLEKDVVEHYLGEEFRVALGVLDGQPQATDEYYYYYC
jgi:hypothetical protein